MVVVVEGGTVGECEFIVGKERAGEEMRGKNVRICRSREYSTIGSTRRP
jgi:hypothetical protein